MSGLENAKTLSLQAAGQSLEEELAKLKKESEEETNRTEFLTCQPVTGRSEGNVFLAGRCAKFERPLLEFVDTIF